MAKVAAANREQDWKVSARHFSVRSKWIAEDDCRLDASTYTGEIYEALRVLAECPYGTEPLEQLIGSIRHPTEDQARSNFKRIWVKAGIPFLTGRQLFFFRPDREKHLSGRMPKLEELRMRPRTILLSRSGTVGYPVLVGKWLAQFAVTDDALRITPGRAPVGYVYAFLASRLARALILRGEYGKAVGHLEAKHILHLPVPALPPGEKEAIHDEILRASALRDAANEILDDADAELHELLGVSPFTEEDIEYLGTESDPRAFAVRATVLVNRLDATHYVPIARSAVHKLEGGRFQLTQLGDRVARVYVAPRFARIYVEEAFGTPLLQGSQLPMIRPYGLKYISRTKTRGLARWIIHSGWVLVTCSGTIGRVAVATRMQDNWAASQHILRIIPRQNVTHPGFLAAFLATPFGQHQLKAHVYGGVVDELTEEDTRQVYIPDVPYEAQATCGAKVVKAYEMRDLATQIEDDAIAGLERLVAPDRRGRSFADVMDTAIAHRRLDELERNPASLVSEAELDARLKGLR